MNITQGNQLFLYHQIIKKQKVGGVVLEAKLKDGTILHVKSEERIYALSLDKNSIPVCIDHVEGERLLIEFAEQQQQEIERLTFIKEAAEQARDTHFYNLEKIIEALAGKEQEIKQWNEGYEYILKAIYTQHCTMNHMENTEFERGKISGLINASNIVEKALGNKR